MKFPPHFRRSLAIVVLFSMVAFCAGCAATESIKVHSIRPSNLPGSEVRWIDVSTKNPAGATSVATAVYGDSGFSVSCSPGRVRRMLHVQASKVGANAIKIAEENYPDGWSSCYRATAHLLYYRSPDALEATTQMCLVSSGHLRDCAGI